MPQFSYQITGTIYTPKGTVVNATGTGLIMPDGKEIKLWEQLEMSTPGEDDHRNLDYNELKGLGIFYDGDMCEFEQCYGAEDIAELNDQLAPANSSDTEETS